METKFPWMDPGGVCTNCGAYVTDYECDCSLTYARKEVARLRSEVETLKDVLHTDRDGQAAAFNDIKRIVAGWDWIPAGEWGSYDYTEQSVEALRKEVGTMIDMVHRAAQDALLRSGDLAHSYCCGRKSCSIDYQYRRILESAWLDFCALRNCYYSDNRVVSEGVETKYLCTVRLAATCYFLRGHRKTEETEAIACSADQLTSHFSWESSFIDSKVCKSLIGQIEAEIERYNQEYPEAKIEVLEFRP